MRSELISDGSKLELESGNKIAINLKDTNLKQLKLLMRNTSIPLNDPIRNDLWRELALHHVIPHQSDQEFDTEFDHLITNKLPQFVDPRIGRFFGLNSEGKKHVTTILWNLSQCMSHLNQLFVNHLLLFNRYLIFDMIKIFSTIQLIINQISDHLIARLKRLINLIVL